MTFIWKTLHGRMWDCGTHRLQKTRLVRVWVHTEAGDGSCWGAFPRHAKSFSCSSPHRFSGVGSSRGSKKLRALPLVLLSCSWCVSHSLGGQYCRDDGSLLKSNSCTLGAHSHLFPSLEIFHQPSGQRINNFVQLAMSILPFLKCFIPGFHPFRSCFTGHSLLLSAGSLSVQPWVPQAVSHISYGHF